MAARGRNSRLCAAASLPALLLLGLVAGFAGAPAGSPALPVASALRASAPSNATPTLVVSPVSWWMVAGNTTGLAATWAGVPAGCTNAPVWFRWSVVAGWVEGTLSPLDQPWANFSASSVDSGNARIVVHAAAIVACGSNETAVRAAAFANVTVVVPPALGPLVARPDPIASGAATNLTGTVANGAPPFRLDVDWGDGNRSAIVLAAPGPFALPHTYPSGTFQPRVTVTDSAGLSATAAAAEPLAAGSNVTVGLAASAYATEVGWTDRFTGIVLDPPPSYSEVASCSEQNASVRPRPAGSVASVPFECTFSVPGTAEVTFEVIPVGDGLPPVQTTLSVPVTPPLSVATALAGPPGEVGAPSVVSVTVAGGVPPFAVDARLTGNASVETAAFATDGTALLPLWATEAGTFGVTVTVTDSLGASAVNASTRLAVVAPLNASALIASHVAADGAALAVSGTVVAGSPPFGWCVAPAAAPANETSPEGNLSGVGEFSWEAVVPREGTSSVTVGVVDRAGAVDWTTLSAPLVPRLLSRASLALAPNGSVPSLRLNLTVDGGLPPFEVWMNSSAADLPWNATLPRDGTFSWTSRAEGSGLTIEEVVLVDRLGARWAEPLTVNLSAGAAPPSPPPPAPPPESAALSPDGATAAAGVAATLGLTGVAAFLAHLWRRRARRRRVERPGPDPVAVLKRIIEPADGADRATVELLAEEHGVPSSEVRATLDRLVGDGTLRSETGPDGEEVLSWPEPDEA